MHKNYKIKAKNLLAQALNIETELISDTASPKEIENWDSLNQLKLAMILEKEINRDLSTQEILSLMNLKSIINILKNSSSHKKNESSSA